VAEQKLDRPDVGAVFKQMDGKCMAQTVRGNRLGNAANAMRLLTRIFNGASRDGLAHNISRKQPRPGLLGPPPYAEDVQQSW
jgi:hypothetical protein